MLILLRAGIGLAFSILALVWAAGFLYASFAWQTAGSLSYLGISTAVLAILSYRWR